MILSNFFMLEIDENVKTFLFTYRMLFNFKCN